MIFGLHTHTHTHTHNFLGFIDIVACSLYYDSFHKIRLKKTAIYHNISFLYRDTYRIVRFLPTFILVKVCSLSSRGRFFYLITSKWCVYCSVHWFFRIFLLCDIANVVGLKNLISVWAVLVTYFVFCAALRCVFCFKVCVFCFKAHSCSQNRFVCLSGTRPYHTDSLSSHGSPVSWHS